jgi:plasmid replication initiation protein
MPTIYCVTNTIQRIDKNISVVLVLLKITRRKIMKNLLVKFLKYLTKNEEQGAISQSEPQQKFTKNQEDEEKQPILESKKQKQKKPKEPKKARGKKQKEGDIVTIDPRDIRDVMELMEIPFVALSKHRTEPIIYENHNGKTKVKISSHRDHYLASIYDWDIILLVSSKLQEIMNSKSDIPPRTLIIPRHELLKSIYKHDGKKNKKEIEASLARLQLTGIETTIHNEDYRYRGGFGFLDNWGYTERKDVKEFRITLSEWLYEITCRKGALLKVHPEYFMISSGLKRFLYRTARKHVGIKNESWTFPIESLYEKSGSEQELKKFKYDLRKSVKDNDIPGYLVEWIEKEGKTSVRFINVRKEIKRILSEPSAQPPLPFL